MTRVVFLLAPDVVLLDVAGPAQVFYTAGSAGVNYELSYVAEHPLITTGQGVPLVAELEWPQLQAGDLIFVPGWRSPLEPGSGAFHPETLQRLVQHHDRGGTVVSVCSGALALGRAGLLDGRRCTTHHELQDELAARNPSAHVVPDVLFTSDNRVLTSAGIASGIDLALHILEQRHGPTVATQVARGMVVFARRNGDAAQLSVMLRYRSHVDELVHRVQDHIDENFSAGLPLATLASVANASARTVTRAFTTATGITPLQYQQLLRQERAELLISQGATIDAAAREVGYENGRMLRRLRQQNTLQRTA